MLVDPRDGKRPSFPTIATALMVSSFAIAAACFVSIVFQRTNLAQPYENPTYGFSISLPPGYAAYDFSQYGTETVIIESSDNKGIQLEISPWDEPPDALTPSRITEDTGLHVSGAEPLRLQGAEGYSFQTDSDAFNGASADAWFIHDGYVYQLSTYAMDEPLLRAILSTWKFR